MTDVALAFHLAKPDALVVERLSAGWLGGRISTEDVTLNPADPKFDATLVADILSRAGRNRTHAQILPAVLELLAL